MSDTCNEFVSWWQGEYEGNCELPKGHDGDHFDGLSWYNDEHECTDNAHAEDNDASDTES
jgi:hypothetical protein